MSLSMAPSSSHNGTADVCNKNVSNQLNRFVQHKNMHNNNNPFVYILFTKDEYSVCLLPCVWWILNTNWSYNSSDYIISLFIFLHTMRISAENRIHFEQYKALKCHQIYNNNRTIFKRQSINVMPFIAITAMATEFVGKKTSHKWFASSVIRRYCGERKRHFHLFSVQVVRSGI